MTSHQCDKQRLFVSTAVIFVVRHRGRYLSSYVLVGLGTAEDLEAASSRSSHICDMQASRGSKSGPLKSGPSKSGPSKSGPPKTKRAQVVVRDSVVLLPRPTS